MAIITKRRKTYSVIYQKEKNGKTRTVWETYYDYPSAVDRQKELEENLNNDMITLDQDEKVVDFLKQYVTKVGPQKWSISRCDIYKGIINNYLICVFDKNKIKDIDDEFGFITMEKLSRMPAVGKRHQTGSQYVPISMQKTTLTLLRNAFDYLVFNQLILSNPYHDVTLKNSDAKKKGREWNLPLVECLFMNIEDVLLFVFVHILFSTGLNIFEIIGLSWKDIHIDEELIESDKCYLQSVKVLKRLNKTIVSSLPKEQIIHQFKCEGFNQTNTSLTLMYKTKIGNPIHIHKPVALLLKEWKILQKKYYSKENVNDLVITLSNGRPCDERNLNKMYHKVESKNNLHGLTLSKLKYFSQKKVTKTHQTQADRYYAKLEEPLAMPEPVKACSGLFTLRGKDVLTQSVNLDVFKEKDENIYQLLQQIQNDPKLKMRIISKIKESI